MLSNSLRMMKNEACRSCDKSYVNNIILTLVYFNIVYLFTNECTSDCLKNNIKISWLVKRNFDNITMLCTNVKIGVFV